MINSENQFYDLSSIKLYTWFLMNENLIKYFGGEDGWSIFKVNSIGTDVLNKFGITPNLIVTCLDEDDMQISSPEKFRNF